MECNTCQLQMKIDKQAKENGSWFLWYRCTQCGEGYLHKSPFSLDSPSSDETSDPIASK